MTTSVTPAPASVSRTRSRRRSGDGRYGGIGVSRQQLGHDVVAADPGDLLGDVGLDEQVAPPRSGRSRAPSRRRRRSTIERLRAAATVDRRPGRRRLGGDADPAEQRALLVGRQLGAEEAVDPRRSEGDTRRRRLRGVRVDGAGRDASAGPLADEARRPIRAEPCEAMLLALLEAQARLGAEGVPERGPADAHRVEDGRFDRDVRSSRPRSPSSAPPMTPAMPIGPAGSAMIRVSGVELAADVVERLEPLPGARATDDDPPVANRRRRRTCGSACRARASRSC